MTEKCDHYGWKLICNGCHAEFDSYDKFRKAYDALRADYGHTVSQHEKLWAFLKEAHKRIEAGGPLALSEFIVVKEQDHRIWLKVIDVKKGYWAEAPLNADALSLLTMYASKGPSASGMASEGKDMPGKGKRAGPELGIPKNPSLGPLDTMVSERKPE